MRRWQIAALLLLCAAAGSAWLVHDRLVVRRTPEYIHTHVTPSYEAEAREYYETNAETLARLTALLPELAEGERYEYPRVDPAGDEAALPKALLDVAEELWREDGERPYSIFMTREGIDIWFATGTCFDVSLVYGDPDGTAYDGTMPDWEKNTPLGKGWMIQAPYILRG